jgi:hypothetical protein
MSGELLPLQVWAERVYGENAPSIVTLRAWARDARIQPAPEKHGRTYFVPAGARYVEPGRKPRKRLVSRLYGSENA